MYSGTKKRALIAMSGGVDSSVAAFLMKDAGYDCIGVTMKLFDETDKGMRGQNVCTADAAEDAGAVAERLGIPYHVFSFKEAFKEKVMDHFVEQYRQGMTPNPCVECNRYLKFDQLFLKGKEFGCDVIATGHYARIMEDADGFHLLKGKNTAKDQSYVLHSLTREQLAHTRFPLGNFTKEAIRTIAREQGFENSEKKESQDICFIPDGDYLRFIEERTGQKSVPGCFVDREGRVLGTHKGYYAYTVGQRRGLGIASTEPYYVIGIRPRENEVVLGRKEDLYSKELVAAPFHWIETVKPGEVVGARIRYHQPEKDAVVAAEENGRVHLNFLEPQRAVTKGQAVVLYRGDTVMGGGTIIS